MWYVVRRGTSNMAKAGMAKAKVKVKKVAQPTFTEQQIAERAYSLFEAEGHVHGNDERHWLLIHW